VNCKSYDSFESLKEDSIRNAIIEDNEQITVNVHLIVSYNRANKIYTAHALEFDIVGESKTKKGVVKDTLELIINHISFCKVYNNKDKIISPAPDEYWREFFEKTEEEYIIKPKIPKLTNSQMPFRPSQFNNVCVVSG
jgi:hypothetical protein